MLTAGAGADDGEDGASIRGGITLYTDQVDALYEEIGGLADVRYAPTDQSYGQRDFALDDRDGYMLVFGQSVAQGSSGGRRHRGPKCLNRPGYCGDSFAADNRFAPTR